ncbi:thiamine pyrophosphate-binding protein [Streptomyces sp. NPDC051561]|uniref:thiamine pyrophosphate-binding protein n=1 Tax=Streptomyces sp. NPDC051561 TaxID=3365658 RepID=UPI003788CC8B
MTHDHDLVLTPTDAQKTAALAPPPGRTGGDLVVETLRGLGVTTVFGTLGADATDALSAAVRRSALTAWTGFATSTGAGHAADGFGRVTGEAAALLAPEGLDPAVLREALSASAPLIVLATGPAAGADVKAVHEARTPSRIPTAVAEAWEAALTAPHGPVWLELDPAALAGETLLPEVNAPDVLPHELPPRPELTALAAHWLETAAAPLIVTGGGATRSDAAGKVKALAARLTAPVATTLGGAGTFAGARPVTAALLESADVLLLVGTTLADLDFTPPARLIQIDADPARLEARHAPALGIHADARLALTALLETAGVREAGAAAVRETGAAAREAAAAVRETARTDHLPPPALRTEGLAALLRQALPPRTLVFWDSPAADFHPRHPNTLHAPQSGATGYALPAALGAATADPDTAVLAVSGVTPSSVRELATARELGLAVVWLVVDAPSESELAEAAAEAGVVVVRAEAAGQAEALRKALAAGGPAVVAITSASLVQPSEFS